MRYSVLFIILLLSASAHADQSRITEYPDHILVEITGSGSTTRKNGDELQKVEAPAGKKEMDTAERTAFLSGEIERLKVEKDAIMAGMGGESPEELRQKRVLMNEKIQTMNRYANELGQLRAKAAGSL